VAALFFLCISLAVFFVFGRIYRRLMRHLPGAVPMKFSFQRILR
jgi:polar amino acid transport system permease protein